jgi:Cu/Ag efflux protein CusF
MNKHLLRSAVVVTLAAVAVAFAPSARAEDKAEKKAEKPKMQQFTGVIEAIDATAGTLSVKKKDETKSFTLCPKCKYAVPAKEGATAADFKAGDKVVIAYVVDGDKSVCKKLGLAPAKGAEPKADKAAKPEKKEQKAK